MFLFYIFDHDRFLDPPLQIPGNLYITMFGDRQSLGFSRDLWGFCWGSLQISEKHLKNKKEKGKEHKRTEVLHVNPI